MILMCILFLGDVVDQVLLCFALDKSRPIQYVVCKKPFSLNDDDVNLNGSTGCYARIVFVLSMTSFTNSRGKKERKREGERKGKHAFFLFRLLIRLRTTKTFYDVYGIYKSNLGAIFMRKGSDWDQTELLVRKKNGKERTRR